MKTWITKFLLKLISFQGICMICQYKKYTYISPNTIESINKDLHEKQMTQGVYMYILKFGNTNIYMKWKLIKQIRKWEYKFKMHESSKLDYTSTSNGFK